MKNTLEVYPEEKELIRELAVLLRDEFIATVEETENGIAMRFLNGNVWNIKVEKVS